MANPLYQQFGQQPTNPIAQIIAQAQEMRRTFQGDPRQVVQGLLNSGQMTQQQFNALSQQANAIMAQMRRQ